MSLRMGYARKKIGTLRLETKTRDFCSEKTQEDKDERLGINIEVKFLEKMQ